MWTISLQSGSSGNCIYVEAGETRLLFDAGISAAQALKRLSAAGRSIRRCDALIISHDHWDHASGAGTFHRRLGLPVYMSPRVWRAIRPRVGPIAALRPYLPGETLQIKDVRIHTMLTPHDGIDSTCFIVEHEQRRLGIFTDLGRPFLALTGALAEVDAAYLECNFDSQMLWSGSYTPALKRRIAGAGGHLCNLEAAELVRQNCRGRLQWLALAHLSEENNTPELALETVRARVGGLLPLQVSPRYEAGAPLSV